jgi:hypothetical protein
MDHKLGTSGLLRVAGRGFWTRMRLARNDAGHPVSIDPVTHGTVHAALLLFPEFASLVRDLEMWISSTMT